MKSNAPSVALAALALLVVPSFLTAAPLTWTDCLREAAKGHPALLAARAALEVAQANVKGAAGEFLPQLSADASYARSGSDRSSPGEDFSTGVSARQSLYAGGANTGRFQQSRARLRSAEAGWDTARADVTFSLRSAFARLLYAQEQLALTRAIATRRRDNVRLVELRFEAGREHRGSFLRSRAALSQADFEVAQSERAQRVAHRELLRAMGRSGYEAVVVTGTLAAPIRIESPPFDALVETVPAFRQAEADVASAEAGVSIARSGLLPSLDARASAGRDGGDWPPQDESWSTGATLSYSFFPGGRNLFDYRSAQANRRLARSLLADERNRIVLDLENAHASYLDAAQRAAVQEEFLSAAAVRAEIARSQYTSGLLTFDDWDVIENDLISTQKSHLAALRDAMIAEAAWTEAQGKGDIQ